MWMIIELISKNPEISLSSRNNPEMSQRSSDVPMLAIFSIYIFPWHILWTGLYRLKYIFSIDNNANQKSETFNKSQLSEFFDVPPPCLSDGTAIISGPIAIDGSGNKSVPKILNFFVFEDCSYISICMLIWFVS